RRNLGKYLEELGRRDFSTADSGLAGPLPFGLPADYRLAGNAACTACHKADCAQWVDSKHGQAWRTLSERGFQVDSYCQQCHTKNPTIKTVFAARDQCVRCHDRENSPGFQYRSYWERIRHGAKSATPAQKADK